MDDKTRSERFLDATGMADWKTASMMLNDGDFPAMFGEGDWIAEDHRPVNIPRWLLIENGRFGQTWATLHPSPEDAASYHDGQEYVGDWGDYKLHDLDTGDEYYPEIKTTFVKFDRA